MVHILRFIFWGLLSLTSVTVNATAQQPDEIVISGKSYLLQTNPLDNYLEKIGWKPPEEANIWSSNWRGCIAIWGKEGDHLVLEDVTIQVDGPNNEDPFDEISKSIINDLFPNKHKVVADWYSGALIVPVGERIEYVHMGYGSTYSKYNVLIVKSGVIRDSLNFDADKFEIYRKSKFDVFKNTKLYQSKLKELTTGEDAWSKDNAEGFMYNFYAENYLSQ